MESLSTKRDKILPKRGLEQSSKSLQPSPVLGVEPQGRQWVLEEIEGRGDKQKKGQEEGEPPLSTPRRCLGNKHPSCKQLWAGVETTIPTVTRATPWHSLHPGHRHPPPARLNLGTRETRAAAPEMQLQKPGAEGARDSEELITGLATARAGEARGPQGAQPSEPGGRQETGAPSAPCRTPEPTGSEALLF